MQDRDRVATATPNRRVDPTSRGVDPARWARGSPGGPARSPRARHPADGTTTADETAPLKRLDGAARPGRRAERTARTEKATSLLAAASHAGAACLAAGEAFRYILRRFTTETK